MFTGYATPNDEAKKFVPQEMLDDPAIFPPDDVMASLEAPTRRLRTTSGRIDIWADFKSAIG